MSPREKGQHLLMLGDDMWVYLPDTSRPVRITPLERLSRRRLQRRRGPHQLRRRLLAPSICAPRRSATENCYVLDLTAKRKGSTYQRILYWLRVEDARPVRAEFYLTSGKHIKSATFDEYAISRTARPNCAAGRSTTRFAITPTASLNTPASLRARCPTSSSIKVERIAFELQNVSIRNLACSFAGCLAVTGRCARCPAARTWARFPLRLFRNRRCNIR